MGNACAAEREGKGSRPQDPEAVDDDFLGMLEKGWQEGIGQAHGAIGELVKDIEKNTSAMLGTEKKPIQTKEQAKSKLFKYAALGDLDKVKALFHFRRSPRSPSSAPLPCSLQAGGALCSRTRLRLRAGAWRRI
mmetsp:Transcript_24192/g.38002  ORF Transcript_24192/g.38002 Transcript_24192/m.38002 type:complete len:134 (-) Transcript_24192:1032-1433(-)